MKNSIFFSIIITFYNNEKYVEKCLSTILTQMRSNYELIIIDDGSLDKTCDIIKKMIRMQQGIRFIKLEHGGVSIARNTGIKQSSGEYIIFIDGDDWIQEEAIRKVEKFLMNNSVDILLMDTIKFYETQNKLVYEKLSFDKLIADEKKIYQLFIDNDIVARPWRFIVKRSYIIINQIYFVPKLLHEDEVWSIKLLSNVSNIKYYKGKYYYYRKHGNSITSKKNNDNYIDIIKNAELIYKYLKHNHVTKYYEKYLQYVIFRCLRNAYSKYCIFDGKMKNFLDRWYYDNYNCYKWVIKWSKLCLFINCICSYKKGFYIYNLIRKKLRLRRNKRKEITIND